MIYVEGLWMKNTSGSKKDAHQESNNPGKTHEYQL